MLPLYTFEEPLILVIEEANNPPVIDSQEKQSQPHMHRRLSA